MSRLDVSPGFVRLTRRNRADVPLWLLNTQTWRSPHCHGDACPQALADQRWVAAVVLFHVVGVEVPGYARRDDLQKSLAKRGLSGVRRMLPSIYRVLDFAGIRRCRRSGRIPHDGLPIRPRRALYRAFVLREARTNSSPPQSDNRLRYRRPVRDSRFHSSHCGPSNPRPFADQSRRQAGRDPTTSSRLERRFPLQRCCCRMTNLPDMQTTAIFLPDS